MDKKNNSFTIEWHSIVKDLTRNIIIIVEAVLIGLMAAFVMQHSMYKPEYTSTATFVVNARVANSASYSNLSVTSEMTKIFCEIFQQPSMKRNAAAYAGRSFKGNLTAEAVSGTNLMQISVTSDDPENSYQMVKAILAVYPEISDKIFSNAVLDVIKQPEIPHNPSNSFSRQNRTLIVAGCSLFIVAIIVLLSIFRDTIKDEQSFEEKIDSKLLGVIVHERKKSKIRGINKKALLIHESSFTSLKFTEGFHKITAKLEYMNRRHGDKVFAITSVAENEGKSTTASNIAISLASRGNKVLLFDLDEKKPALYKIFELEYKENAELGDLFMNKISPAEFVFRRYKKSRLFLAANTKAHKEYQRWYENGAVGSVIDSLRDQVDFIIVDTAPMSVDASVTNIVEIVDKSILVVRTDVVHTASINDAILTIKDVGGELAGCILNDVYPEFSMFGQSGFDESGYAYSGYYGTYNKYSRYGKYNRYGKYARYGKYSRYGKYGKYVSGEDILQSDAAPEDDVIELGQSKEGGAKNE